MKEPLAFASILITAASVIMFTLIIAAINSNFLIEKEANIRDSNLLNEKLNLIDQRDIQTDYDLYALAVGNNVAGSVLSNLDIPLSEGVICDVSKIPISNIHFGNKGMQIWYNDFEKGNVMTTLTNRTKIYQVGENKTIISADEFCGIIQQK